MCVRACVCVYVFVYVYVYLSGVPLVMFYIFIWIWQSWHRTYTEHIHLYYEERPASLSVPLLSLLKS